MDLAILCNQAVLCVRASVHVFVNVLISEKAYHTCTCLKTRQWLMVPTANINRVSVKGVFLRLFH